MAFAMRDEWKDEPVSTTGASYVEPSATNPIKPGQRVAHMFPRAVMEEYVLQRVTERVWWVSRHFYGSLFYVGKRGVLLLDPFLGGADATLKAIASVTPLPVTAVVYSHFHADHVGGARRLFELLAAAPPRVIGSEHTAVWMERFGSDLPRPTDVLEWPSGALSFEDVTLRLHGLPRPGHAPDHSVFLLEEERVGVATGGDLAYQLKIGQVDDAGLVFLAIARKAARELGGGDEAVNARRVRDVADDLVLLGVDDDHLGAVRDEQAVVGGVGVEIIPPAAPADGDLLDELVVGLGGLCAAHREQGPHSR